MRRNEVFMEAFIKEVKGREVLDSRGNPTVEAQITLYDGTIGLGIAPSGASTGHFEALELRDNDRKRFHGKGVQKAVENINKEIAALLVNVNICDITKIDKMLLSLDGTEDKKRIGANAILAVSIAAANAASQASGMPVYRYIGGVAGNKLPVPMMNILNGGAHSKNSLDVQEFMILPIGANCFKEGMRWCVEVYHTLAKILDSRGLATAVGDEGGFAPDIESPEKTIELILEAIETAGYSYGKEKQFMITIDAASSEWKSEKDYLLPKSGQRYTTMELINYWEKLVDKYPIFSIEDPLDEEDWEGWRMLTSKIGDKVILVGDDLFVTNAKRLQQGIDNHCGNAILIKPNQIGSIYETIKTVQLAKDNGLKTIMSHRSGETEDTIIADLAVALNAGYIKTGAPCRGERTAKYNRLLRIEEDLVY